MRHFFLIQQLEDGWDWNDILEVDEMSEEYCVSVLEIPSEFIEDISIDMRGLGIRLEKTKEYLYEDWYTNLSRVCEPCAKCA
jgi:hypothetical protein